MKKIEKFIWGQGAFAVIAVLALLAGWVLPFHHRLFSGSGLDVVESALVYFFVLRILFYFYKRSNVPSGAALTKQEEMLGIVVGTLGKLVVIVVLFLVVPMFGAMYLFWETSLDPYHVPFLIGVYEVVLLYVFRRMFNFSLRK